MTLSRGSRIGPYEIAEPIGAGGMGEVFRARDLNLGRTAAIKVLPAALAVDSERLARFEREAQTLAALNHPNIAQVFGFEKGDNEFRALAMEFVDGPTLADRIATGPIPVDEAIAIAAQIADALESAHDSGIIHRDLKPANVKVRPDGTVKVLDFGLAKAIKPKADAAGMSDNSATITTPAVTNAGVILGTAAYMSPEQAKGRVVDRRADIWAFGCVLFEMLGGRRAFGGGDVSEVLVSVLRDDPKWESLPSTTPPHVRDLIRWCLEKDVKKRLPHIGVARLGLSEPPRAIAAPATRRSIARFLIPVAAVLGALAVGVPTYLLRPLPAPRTPPTRLKFDLGISVPPIISSMALSPNGSALAFTVVDAKLQSSLYVRQFDGLDAHLVRDAKGAQTPFFSTDGQWVGFFAEGKLMKASLDGGRVITVGDAASARGGAWGEDDAIVFATPAGLQRIPSAGGGVETIARSEAGASPSAPQVLPGGRGVLYSQAARGDATSAAIFVLDLSNGQTRLLLDGARSPQYVPTGHLMFFRGARMFAAPFDLKSLSLAGEAVPVVENIQNVPGIIPPVMAVSSSGTLVYQMASESTVELLPIMWLARNGATSTLRATPSAWLLPRFSPDGRRLALTLFGDGQFDIWVYDLERDIMTRITSNPAADTSPVWTADGAGLIFASTRGSTSFNLYVQRADGTGEAQRLTTSGVPQLPDSIDPSGRVLIFHQGDPQSGRLDLMRLELEGDMRTGLKAGAASSYISGPFLKVSARISPDGKWVAYAANDTGVMEIYVQPFTGPGNRVQISSGGAPLAMWAPKTNELVYATAQDRMMAVTYTASGDTFMPSKPRLWTEARFSAFPPIVLYGPGLDIHPDGTRIAASTGPDQRRLNYNPGPVVAVFDFFEDLRRLVPAK